MRENACDGTDRVDARIVSALLAERIEALATGLIGEAPSARSRSAIRYFAHGGMVITIAGPDRGLWCHHGAGGVGGDPLDLLVHLRRCSLAEAILWAREWLGIIDPLPLATGLKPAIAAESEEASFTLAQAHSVWAEGVPAAGTLVERYLHNRNLALPSNAPLRFHPNCPRGGERLPAMLGLMTDAATAEFRGVHRTFLARDGSGKATGKAKMMMGRAGVIRISPDTEVTLGLGITEGAETALAVLQHARWGPVWACGSAGAVRKFPVLGGVECITIFADADDQGAGIEAARICAANWTQAGNTADIRLPPKGKDWADVIDELLV
jgi:hypothetical protein